VTLETTTEWSTATVWATYQQALAERGYQSDEAQRTGVKALAECELAWVAYRARRANALTRLVVRPPVPKGVYLWGGVGRGKSFLMDCFYQAVPVRRKTRLHFHEFMREVHRELQGLKGTADPLQTLAERVAHKHRLICFDEFHVADVTDAMILHRLLDALFTHRVGIVTTSNFPPDGLYPNGLHRERVLPAIAMLKQQMVVVNVDAGVDYRRQALQSMGVYHAPLGDAAHAALQSAFDRVAESKADDPVLHIEHRALACERRAGGVVWFTFAQLCAGPRSQNDYLEIATRFHTLILSGVPVMVPRMASEARRFTLLVDVLYDRRVKLVMSAQAAPEQLYVEGPLAHEFARTASRLHEMQSSEYLALSRRDVDTSLT
jgi:cell division protein ZapE